MFRAFLAALVLALLPASPALAQDWNATIAATAKGMRLGNPDAPLQLIEFVSYTCPHCARFETESEAELKLVHVREGRVAVEVRHLIRNPVDLAAALLAECGPDNRFFANHRALLATQDTWLGRAQRLTAAQQARWSSGTMASRLRAIAADLGLYALMEGRGYRRAQLDQCLSDEARATALAEASVANSAEFGVTGTPSFVLNGTLLQGVHSWGALAPVLAARAR